MFVSFVCLLAFLPSGETGSADEDSDEREQESRTCERLRYEDLPPPPHNVDISLESLAPCWHGSALLVLGDSAPAPVDDVQEAFGDEQSAAPTAVNTAVSDLDQTIADSVLQLASIDPNLLVSSGLVCFCPVRSVSVCIGETRKSPRLLTSSGDDFFPRYQRGWRRHCGSRSWS